MELSSTSNPVQDIRAIVIAFQSAKIGGERLWACRRDRDAAGERDGLRGTAVVARGWYLYVGVCIASRSQYNGFTKSGWRMPTRHARRSATPMVQRICLGQKAPSSTRATWAGRWPPSVSEIRRQRSLHRTLRPGGWRP